eukprot:5440994-Pleurochrysis_carterae.AAC.2
MDNAIPKSNLYELLIQMILGMALGSAYHLIAQSGSDVKGFTHATCLAVVTYSGGVPGPCGCDEHEVVV